MITTKSIKLIFGLLAISTLLVCCDQFEKPENELTTSSWGEDESHHFGEDCMNCHYQQGLGEGWFTVAGSAVGKTNNATIELYQNLGSQPIMKIPVDQLGNFYTTNTIDFGENGLIVGVRSSSGNIEYMGSRIHFGSCNTCHNQTEELIEIE